MAQDLGALQEIFDTINQLEKKEIKRRSITETEELFFYPLALATALLALALLLRFTLLNASPMAVAT
jgi:Ca-activated chloride channel family protein